MLPKVFSEFFIHIIIDIHARLDNLPVYPLVLASHVNDHASEIPLLLSLVSEAELKHHTLVKTYNLSSQSSSHLITGQLSEWATPYPHKDSK